MFFDHLGYILREILHLIIQFLCFFLCNLFGCWCCIVRFLVSMNWFNTPSPTWDLITSMFYLCLLLKLMRPSFLCCFTLMALAIALVRLTNGHSFLSGLYILSSITSNSFIGLSCVASLQFGSAPYLLIIILELWLLISAAALIMKVLQRVFLLVHLLHSILHTTSSLSCSWVFTVLSGSLLILLTGLSMLALCAFPDLNPFATSLPLLWYF